MSTLTVGTIKSNTTAPPIINNSGGTEIGTFCRAWVNFDGTGTFSPNPSTTKIRADFNVSSITDNGVGDYTVNFTNALEDANYAANVTTQSGGIAGAVTLDNLTARTTTALRVGALTTAGSFVDSAQMGVSVFR